MITREQAVLAVSFLIFVFGIAGVIPDFSEQKKNEIPKPQSKGIKMKSSKEKARPSAKYDLNGRDPFVRINDVILLPPYEIDIPDIPETESSPSGTALFPDGAGRGIYRREPLSRDPVRFGEGGTEGTE